MARPDPERLLKAAARLVAEGRACGATPSSPYARLRIGALAEELRSTVALLKTAQAEITRQLSAAPRSAAAASAYARTQQIAGGPNRHRQCER